MYKNIDNWDALSERLAHPLDFLFQLVKDDDLLLFMPYVVKHERTEVICRLIEPEAVGIDHKWCASFVNDNAARIEKAKTVGRARVKGNDQASVARIFTAIADFESRESVYDIQDFQEIYANIKTKGPDPEGFEWEGLDATYPIALLAKTDAGEAGHLCSLVITLVYKSAGQSKLKHREFIEKYLTSLAKYKINVTKVAKELGDLDATEWNAFRSCFNEAKDFSRYAFHHITHGGDVKRWEWNDGKGQLKAVARDLLIGADYPDDSKCVCEALLGGGNFNQSDGPCVDEVLGYPKDKPSVRELLQWNFKGQSLTRVLLMSKPKSISVLGQVNHDYCWFNPLCIEELVKKIDESNIHSDECASCIPNSGKLQGVYAFEEDFGRHKGLWLCAHTPGMLTPKEWGAIGGFGQVMILARRSGANNVYRIDWDASSNEQKIWRINENGQPWVNEVANVQEEFGSVVKHILPQSGLVFFIPARDASDGRNCWEVSID